MIIVVAGVIIGIGLIKYAGVGGSKEFITPKTDEELYEDDMP